MMHGPDEPAIKASFAGVHWHEKSSSLQVVLSAAARKQLKAQEGRPNNDWAETTEAPARAAMAMKDFMFVDF